MTWRDWLLAACLMPVAIFAVVVMVLYRWVALQFEDDA